MVVSRPKARTTSYNRDGAVEDMRGSQGSASHSVLYTGTRRYMPE
jgi:hypothetical protein